MTALVNKHIAAFASNSPTPFQQNAANPPSRPRCSDNGVNDERIAQRAGVRLSEGDVRGAIRVLCSSDGVAISDHPQLTELELLHPPVPPDRRPTPLSSVAPLSTTPAAVYAAVMAFPNGSVGGPHGLRPQHLKD